MEERREEGKIPAWQLIFDDVFLLFLAGVVVPVVLYTLWGLMEIANVPTLPPIQP